MPNVRVLWILLALLLAGCRDSPTASVPPAEPGRFHATLSGAVSAEVEGAAWVYSLAISGREVFLQTEDQSYAISFSGPILGTSGFDFQVGTHRIGALVGGGTLDAALNTLAADGEYFMATSGELRITESTPDRVVAQFDFQALADPAGARKQVRVRGAFHADRFSEPAPDPRLPNR